MNRPSRPLAVAALLATILMLAVPACGVAGGFAGTDGSPPIALGIEYQIPDTPVILALEPTAKGGYSLDFRAQEGEITDWLTVEPDGSYLIETGSGTAIRIRRALDGQIQATVLATGENVSLQPVSPIP